MYVNKKTYLHCASHPAGEVLGVLVSVGSLPPRSAPSDANALSPGCRMLSPWVSVENSIGLVSAPGENGLGALQCLYLSLCLLGNPSPGGRNLPVPRGCPAEPCSCDVGGTIAISLGTFSLNNSFEEVIFSNSQTSQWGV